MAKSDWERFFDGHAPVYMDNCFTKATQAEVEFIQEVLAPPPGARILDIGCGTGRHSVALAQRGYRMTGVDLSTGMLAQARKAADAAGVAVEWIQANAVEFSAPPTFDAALCLCEGALGLLGAADDPVERDLQILRNISGALLPGAPFLLTTLNACRAIRQATPEDVAAGRFDPVRMMTIGTLEVDTPEGRQNVPTRERSFVPTEMTLMLRLAGFAVEHLWGGTAGNWGKRPIDLDEMEFMVVARKRLGN